MTGKDQRFRVTMISERCAIVDAPHEGIAVHKAVALFKDHPDIAPANVRIVVNRETAANG